jgi:2-C-methyl-D-erythritol 4-phosphate cytidylyltransferase
MTSAIIVAAGSSSRMGFNKLLAELEGVPVIVRTAQVFEQCSAIDEIIVVASDEIGEVLRSAKLTKLKHLIAGGAERHFSVWEGLRSLNDDCDIVAVHDGGRPLIAVEQIAKCVAAAKELRAVACARQVTETLKRCDEKGRIVNSIERKNAWIMETPQVFDRELLVSAYEHVLGSGVVVTDEVSAVQSYGEPVFVVENNTPNLKITYPQDLARAAKMLV